MHGLPVLITDLTLISIYAGISVLLFKWLKQPVVLGYILAGLVVGPYFTWTPSVIDKENITIWADIGVIFLLFSLGLEFSFKKIVNVGKTAIITALTNIIFLLFAGYVTGRMLGWTSTDSLFLGGMISMSSTTIIIKAFEELNLKKQKFTDLVFGILVVEDLAGILLLVLLPTVALGNSVNGLEMLNSIIKLVFFLIACFVTGVYLVPTLLKKVTPYLNDELLLIIAIALCMGMVLLATNSGFSSALGAFIMGSILAETELAHRMEGVLKPVKDFFGAVFFVSVGMLVDPALFIEYAGPIAAIAMVVITGKVFFTCLGAVLSGQSPRTAIQCGFSLAQVGEFAFIIAALGMSLDVLHESVYPIIVAVSVLTTFTTPMMIRSAVPAYHKLKEIIPLKWREILSKYVVKTEVDTQAEKDLWNTLFVEYLLRIVIFSVILFTILNISASYVFPFIKNLLPGMGARILTTLLVLAVMAPFLNALIVFNGKYTNIYNQLCAEKKANRLPLMLLTAFRFVIVGLFVMVAIHEFLSTNLKITLLFVAGLIAVLVKSEWVLSQYIKIEKRFLVNLLGNHTTKAEENETTPANVEKQLKELVLPETTSSQTEETVPEAEETAMAPTEVVTEAEETAIIPTAEVTVQTKEPATAQTEETAENALEITENPTEEAPGNSPEMSIKPV